MTWFIAKPTRIELQPTKGDLASFLVEFSVTPEEKVGSPGEAHHTEVKCIEVHMSGSLTGVLRIRGSSEEVKKYAYWYSVELGLKRCKSVVELNSCSGGAERKLDTSKIDFSAPIRFRTDNVIHGFNPKQKA
jgi:hypothetical protein